VVFTVDTGALPDAVRGLTGYWYSRYLRGTADWVGAIEQAELRVERLAGDGAPPWHQFTARGELVLELLTTQVLLSRAIQRATDAVADLEAQSPPAAWAGEMRADLTSRIGFALHRDGAYDSSAAWLQRSLAICEHELA